MATFNAPNSLLDGDGLASTSSRSWTGGTDPQGTNATRAANNLTAVTGPSGTKAKQTRLTRPGFIPTEGVTASVIPASYFFQPKVKVEDSDGNLIKTAKRLVAIGGGLSTSAQVDSATGLAEIRLLRQEYDTFLLITASKSVKNGQLVWFEVAKNPGIIPGDDKVVLQFVEPSVGGGKTSSGDDVALLAPDIASSSDGSVNVDEDIVLTR